MAAVLFGAAATQASAQVEDSQAIKPVPVFTMGAGFISSFEGGTPHLGPLVSPIFLVPIGQNWLIESRFTFESDLAPPPGRDDFKGVLEKEVDYLQLDYIANRYATFSIGRFLTPFGIYNERLYPIWIRDLQSDPLILPIGVGPSNAGTGVMVRGGFSATPKIEVNYAGYFSAESTTNRFESDRAIGERAGIFLPGPRLEVGASFEHLLQDNRPNAFGFHFAWQPRPLPLDVRGEYARSQNGSGYWIESAYRLSQFPAWQDEMRHFQAVGRIQQFYVSSSPVDSLLPVNTNMFEFGLNYYFQDNFRFVSSYGRQFAPLGGNENIWTLGLTYRLVIPLGNGEVE
ncbi:MAG TPA: hypothetical protein VI216_08395 [Candidatus Acidoferrales bacterium]